MDQINPEILKKIDSMQDLSPKVQLFFKEILEAESITVEKGNKIEAYNKIINRYHDDPEILNWVNQESDDD